MTINNGYATLAEIKKHLQDADTYVASTLSFTAATKTIADTAYGLKRFQAGDLVRITGSVSNNGLFTVVTGNNSASFTVSETVTGEVAGASVTIAAQNDLTDDGELERAVESASRVIDLHCHRRFYTSANDETRYYTPSDDDRLGPADGLDDMVSVTSVAIDGNLDRTYGTTLAATDYDLLPANAALRGEPYTSIETTPLGGYDFPLYPKSVRVVGKFGYSATAPIAIKSATLLVAAYLFKLKDNPLGISANTEVGQIITDPKMAKFVLQMLWPFVKKVLVF